MLVDKEYVGLTLFAISCFAAGVAFGSFVAIQLKSSHIQAKQKKLLWPYSLSLFLNKSIDVINNCDHFAKVSAQLQQDVMNVCIDIYFSAYCGICVCLISNIFKWVKVIVRQWLFCRRQQFTLRDYFAVSYL